MLGALQWQESKNDPNAVSPTGVRGPWQITKATWEKPMGGLLGGLGGTYEAFLENPKLQRQFAENYLYQQYKRMPPKASDEDRMKGALAGWNSGLDAGKRFVEGLPIRAEGAAFPGKVLDYYYKGFGNEEAKDLIQGFFLVVVLGRELIKKADRTRGRFRTLLLTALNNYMISVYRHDKQRQERSVPYSQEDDIPDASPAQPDEAFVYSWATQLLDGILENLKTECCRDNKTVHWEVFNAKFLQPIIHGSAPPSLATICTTYNIQGESQASNMIITVKRRFRRILERHVRNFVESDADVEEEINELIIILSKRGAG